MTQLPVVPSIATGATCSCMDNDADPVSIFVYGVGVFIGCNVGRSRSAIEIVRTAIPIENIIMVAAEQRIATVATT